MSITVHGVKSSRNRGPGSRRRKPPAIAHERLSGELFGLTCAGCDLRKEGVTVNLLRKAILTTNAEFGLSILRLGLSHLTVIRTHILFDHLLSSVEVIIKEKLGLVNQFFWIA